LKINKTTEALIEWYGMNKRDLPWRDVDDPYKVWISEIILQQTRVNQGISYYYRFIEAFPNVNSLAAATSDQVLKLWQGLGYYSRARNLHHAAKQIVASYGGVFPSTYDEIIKLKGIGQYTAAAIASISFNIAVPAVDGNIYRVLSRLFSIAEPIGTNTSYKLFFNRSLEIIDKSRPGIYNQALMELGALVCHPQMPACIDCPLQMHCSAYNDGTITLFPVNNAKVKVQERFFYYFIMIHGSKIGIRKRNENDIWKGLYEFPMIESSKADLHIDEAIRLFTHSVNIDEATIQYISDEYRHKLTHRLINARFIHLLLPIGWQCSIDGVIWINRNDLSNYALPRLIDRYVKESGFID